MEKKLCKYFHVIKKYMTKYKFYLPNSVNSYAPPEGFCSSDCIHDVICTHVCLYGLQGNTFNFSMTVLPNRMQNLSNHNYCICSANTYINVGILLIVLFPLPDTDTSVLL